MVNTITSYKKRLLLCSLIALALCAAQVLGNKILILACLGAYLLFVAWNCSCSLTLPVLLFFLPWSPIMRTDPTSHTFYTFGMVLICIISILKNNFFFRNYQIKAGIFLLFMTLLSKLIDGNTLTFDYIAFIMMVIVFPSVKEEWDDEKYSFYEAAVVLAIGVVMASLCATYLAGFPNLRRYIRVDSYLSIVRRCGFYGDPNSYTAQILAALGGTLALILKEVKKRRVVLLSVLVLFLLYCGALSGSKSFVLVAACLVAVWLLALLRLRGRAGLKTVLLVGVCLSALYIATSSLFSGLIDVLLTRLGNAKTLESFTTGRVSLWMSYVEEILGDTKVFLLGKGFTNVKVNGWGSHSTILQAFFQFGILGVPVIAYWMICFFQNTSRRNNWRMQINLETLLVAVGAFMPWLAIDALFSDEFFLFQMFMCLAVREIGQMRSAEPAWRIKNNSLYGEKYE